MEFQIKNQSVVDRITTCVDELQKIGHIIEGIGPTSHPTPFLTRYSIIKSCGTVEFAFKCIISDIHQQSSTPQLSNYIDKTFRKSSLNPNYENIYKSLKAFDEDWAEEFSKKVKQLPNSTRIQSSLRSLNEARNQFAHGGSPSTTFSTVQLYFQDALRILETIESIVSPELPTTTEPIAEQIAEPPPNPTA